MRAGPTCACKFGGSSSTRSRHEVAVWPKHPCSDTQVASKAQRTRISVRRTGGVVVVVVVAQKRRRQHEVRSHGARGDNPGFVPEVATWITRCHPEVRCVKTHRFAFGCLKECFATSQGASSFGIRAGSSPREASCVSLKSRRSDISRKCRIPSEFCHLRVHHSLRRT